MIQKDIKYLNLGLKFKKGTQFPGRPAFEPARLGSRPGGDPKGPAFGQPVASPGWVPGRALTRASRPRGWSGRDQGRAPRDGDAGDDRRRSAARRE